jgi:hypothetical protein
VKAQPIACTPKALPRSQLIEAARVARDINPINFPPVERFAQAIPGFALKPLSIAVLTTKYWGAKGVKLTVGFLDGPASDLRQRILLHMNAWAKTANVTFTESRAEPQVRIAREGGRNGGYWSYVGTDIRLIPRDQPTMNLEAFTMSTPESEFVRVIRHEAGHTLGFPHEHMRKALVAKIDRRKAIEFFQRTQGWTEQEVIQQVLTPLEEQSLIGTSEPDPRSIMCYQIPGFLTKSGQPILGGRDISALDASFVGTLYPKPPGAKPKTRPKRRVRPKRKIKARPKTKTQAKAKIKAKTKAKAKTKRKAAPRRTAARKR